MNNGFFFYTAKLLADEGKEYFALAFDTLSEESNHKVYSDYFAQAIMTNIDQTDIWTRTSEGYLRGRTSKGILVTDGISIFTQDASDGAGVYPYTCSQGESAENLDVLPSGARRKSTHLSCVAGPNGEFTVKYVCQDYSLAANALGCPSGLAWATIQDLYLGALRQ